ncbi:Sec-independent protein translocase protein TatB [Acetobacter syzygii]|uniref:Sec-independent protein translocase protein TatB n=1 Tax=Acetobacter syzygii TaxID=146476 RepID=UPI00156E9FDE|nr:Sec-independent protein translocase protein TatB [Acetobacter syzygii]NSL93604.1 twin-arginine translocase subunit TatB [Acetobacter syzygii]
MFDFAWSEFALIGAVALVVIGPKDLPVAIRGLAKGLKKARALASEFQSHLDEVVREADLSEVSDHVRDLKNLNVRGRIMRALDGDGTLSKAASSPPLTNQFVPSGPRALDALPRSASPAAAGADYGATPVAGEVYGSAPVWQDAASEQEVENAPPELPPMIVRRILREQERLHPPAILPPVRIMHAGRTVAPSIIPVLAGRSSPVHGGVSTPQDMPPQPGTDKAPTQQPLPGAGGAEALEQEQEQEQEPALAAQNGTGGSKVADQQA